jgi:hypothetical protein
MLLAFLMLPRDRNAIPYPRTVCELLYTVKITVCEFRWTAQNRARHIPEHRRNFRNGKVVTIRPRPKCPGRLPVVDAADGPSDIF